MRIADSLREVASNGWTEQRAEEFVKRYDAQIKKQILYSLMKMSFIRDENELRKLKEQLYGRQS